MCVIESNEKMSTERGNVSRKRPQKYKNRTAFKNDLHDKTPQQKKLNSLHVSEVCEHCKALIQWKIKYKKYKPLSQAKTCTRCHQRNVLKAYHVICRDCALSALICAKCLQSTQTLAFEAAQLSPVEELKLEAEMRRLTKTLPERKRRAFMRYMRRGKKLSMLAEDEQSSESQHVQDLQDLQDDEGKADCEDNDCSAEAEEANDRADQRVPYTRDELLQKLEQLKLSVIDEEDEGDFSDDDEENGVQPK